MASPYKLTYFNVKALGEPTRMLFKYGDIKFEDVYMDFNTWKIKKNETPFGQLPTLEHNGKIANQSAAIARYVAKQVKLCGNNDWEDLEIDAMVDTLKDLRSHFVNYFHEKDENIKKNLKQNLFDIMPYYLKRFDDAAKNNNGYLVLGRLTWADIFFVGILDTLNFQIKQNIIEDYPNLKLVKSNVLNVPALKEWVETRPPTDR